MGFLQRIGRGWRLMSYAFMSVYKEQPYLVTAALFICAVPVLLFFIGALLFGQFTTFTQWLGLPILELSQLRIPEHINGYMILVGALVGLLVVGAYILYSALLYFFKAFLQDQHISFKTAIKAIWPRMPFIFVWLILEMLGRRLILHAVPMPPIVYTMLYTIWVWLSLFVVPVLVLEKTSILNALRISVTVALETLGDIISANLWLLFVVLVPSIVAIVSVAWLANQIDLLAVTSAGLAFALLAMYLVGVFVVTLAFANMLFIVVLYLLSTGQPVPHVPARIRTLYPEQLMPDQL